MFAVDLYKEEYWEVLDPGSAKIVAHFFNGEMAEEYVRWLNESAK